MITTRGIPKPVGWGALLLGVTAVAVAGVHDQHRAQAREQGRLWAASYYAKARAEIAEDERRALAKERRAQAGSHRRAACDAHLPPARCLAADEGTSTVVTTAYVVPTCESLAEREHPGPYQDDWRRGCEESADSRS